MFQCIKKLYHPTVLQGSVRKKNYFEGWYYKHVSAEKESNAFIVGVSTAQSDPHGFIQIIRGRTESTNYFRFPLEEFVFQDRPFSLSVRGNYFDLHRVVLDLSDETDRICCDLRYENSVLYRSSFSSPSIMGPFSYLWFMECNHSVVSYHHAITGTVLFNDDEIDLSGGYGYIEKDWGRSMPSDWIWMQGNDFTSKNVSFLFSAATIPLLGIRFTGFFVHLYLDGVFYKMATYTGAKITEISVAGDRITVVIEDRRFSLSITGDSRGKGELAAPVGGSMSRRIHESLNASIGLRLIDKKTSSLIWEDQTDCAGLEVVGSVR